ncbi:chemotaxis protein CheW [Neosynechococcus sphagnicola sy1]|uniref:Chemotaxis protein CheW n=1 Tax=Neosynechococcus sphagnicola sy1 TaxID=1497020 RepID=A0A098TN67_9CYAN|nr:chemotaxis protein CheW [Neosynechococcus sphagnicola]KGF73770.1 chemotaxis protein CheW [Neosynechococcus sphagnicola sy1]
MNALPLSLLRNQPQSVGDPYLKFQLDRQTPAVLAMHYAQEVLEVPVERLTPMPNMPPYLLGLLNWRSRALWVVDLANMLGLQPLNPLSQVYSIVILRCEPSLVGLALQDVEGVMRVQADAIQSPVGVVATKLVPYLQGCFLDHQQILLVLDAAAIARSPLLHSH